jgi:hypothetical protein
MHRDPVCSRFCEFGNVLVGVLYHQMAVQRKPGCPAQRFHQRRPDRQVRHKMPIHDVDMDDAAAAGGSPLHLVRQVGEIGREYRGCKFDQNRVQDVGSDAVEILARGSGRGRAAASSSSVVEIGSKCKRCLQQQRAPRGVKAPVFRAKYLAFSTRKLRL